ncbi:MAG: ABC transporter permease [Chitinophagaceae bacterium]|nr:ABC transporter permease [Chitinophagaceae bacterium]
MLKNHFKIAWRNITRNKTFASLNIFGLTIGIIVCLVIGVWLEGELSFDDFHPDGKKIFRIANTFKSESESFSQAGSGTALGAQLPKQLPSIQSACRVFTGETFKVKSGNDRFIEPNCIIADSNFFRFFGFRLKRGQVEKVLIRPDQVVLSEKLAIKYFGNADNAMGRSLIVDDNPVIVAGVCENTPLNSHIQFDLVGAYARLRKKANEQWKFDIDNAWTGGWPYTYVQVADPVKWKQVEKKVNEVVAHFSEKEWNENKMSYTYFFQSIRDIHLKSHLRYDAANNGSLSRVNIFSIVGVVVLLLACINYINLTTAGAIRRAKETSVKKVVGATKVQLVRQFFIETFLISAIAVLLGIMLTKSLLPVLSQWLGRSYDLDLSVRNVFVLCCFIMCISFIAGVYPAFILSSFKPSVILKGNFSVSSHGNFIRKGLVVFQFTVSIALIASLIVISQQMRFIKNRSLGYDGNAIVQINVGYAPDVAKNYQVLRDQLLQNPYIINVCRHNGNVVGGLGNGWTTTEDLKGGEISTSLYQFSVDTNYFNTYSMKLAAGRFFSKDFPTDTSKSVLVNEAAVRTFGWKKPENAIGKRFGKGEDSKYVVGVVKDFNFESLHKPVEALMISYAKWGSNLSLKINTFHSAEAIDHLKKVWQKVVPDVILQFSFVDESVEKQYGSENKMQQMFYAFGGLSLLIACLGLFGLSIYVVERKVKEIGIRKVFGASIPGLVNLLSKDFLRLVLIAMIIATPLSWAFMNEWLKDFAYRIDINWSVFVVAGVVAILIALLTVCSRTIKAAMENPVKSLRTE